jgi:hypothetical protein
LRDLGGHPFPVKSISYVSLAPFHGDNAETGICGSGTPDMGLSKETRLIHMDLRVSAP